MSEAIGDTKNNQVITRNIYSMKKYLYTFILAMGMLTNACTTQDIIENASSSFDSGNIRFSVTLPSAGSANGASSLSKEILNYPSDFRVDQINAYLFDAAGELAKSFINIQHQLSETTPTATITLEDVPAGNNQTLICVVNPGAFEQLSSLAETVTLDQLLKFTSAPVSEAHPDAPMFMVSRNTINVTGGTTTTIAGTLARGVGRLDIFTVDASIVVDSVRVTDAAAKGYLLEREEQQAGKISFTQAVQDFEGNSKIAYLNEKPAPAQLEIYLTRDGVTGIANVDIPSVARNTIYSVNLEVRNGTHLVTGTLTITPWETSVVEGSVASDVAFDEDATTSSFRMEDGGSVTMPNDTTLLIPGGKGTGLLCFQDGAEVSVSLVNPADSVAMSINRNKATRGTIKTSFDIQVKPFETTETSRQRDVQIEVTNLMTGKGKVFILRQQAAGYKEISVPLLNFTNSHQHVATLPLEGIASVGELGMPADDGFQVTATKSGNNYQITVKKTRIYEIVPQGKTLTVTRQGKKALLLHLTADRGFIYEEVTMGDVTFMDRDLGAADKNHPGEIFIPGSLMPLDQTGLSSGVANGYVGHGRVSGINVIYNYSTKWFTENGSKNNKIDPCPAGWHVATFADFSKIFTYVTNQRTNPVTNQGSLNTSVRFDAPNKNINVTLNDKILTFNYSGGHFSATRLANDAEWPCGWWSSSKASNGRFQHLAFDVISPYEIGLRVHNMSTSKTGLNIRCVKDNEGSGSTRVIPTVTLGGKEWMAFNSMGKGNAVQLTCAPWENVEDLYKNQWADHLGKLFQWGRKYAHNQWGTYANNPGSETNQYTNWNEKPNQVPCPDGFRIPTIEELNALLPAIQLPRQATYLYGDERVRTELLSAVPATVSGWHGYSGAARYLKISSVETGNYLIIPLSGSKPDKSTTSDPSLGRQVKLWSAIALSASDGRATDKIYVPELRTVATPSVDERHPKEAYDYVRCIKK